NVKPKNYSWPEFYDRVIDLTQYTFSWASIARRFRATRTAIPRWMNVIRAVSSEGFGRIRRYREIRSRLDTDPQVRRFFDGEPTQVPAFYADQVREDLGSMWHWLPPEAVRHDPNAYLNSGTTPPRIREDSTIGPAAGL